ncbi:MAG: hypothetical protein ABIZ52_04795 [Candidatus Limnocylindrales bacterium]
MLAATDLGAIPTIVLTNGIATGEFAERWAALQAALAGMSSESLHMIAIDAGHDINTDNPALVRAAVEAVIAASRTGTPLGSCDARFTTVGAECLDSIGADTSLIEAAQLP